MPFNSSPPSSSETRSIAKHHSYRRLRFFFLLMVGLCALLVISGRIYLGTVYASRFVSKKLSDALGVPVQIKSISPGFGSTTIKEIEIAEDGGASDGKPWATAREIEGDTSIVGLLAGDTPNDLFLRDAHVTLRFDRSGSLLTKLPKLEGRGGGKNPKIRLERSQLTIFQEGHADAVISGIDAEIHTENNNLVLTGTITDAGWGRWNVQLAMDSTSRAGSATLKTREAVTVTADTLRPVPFVSESVWDAVSLNGQTTADIRFEFRPQEDYFHYVVQCAPSETEVFIPSIGLNATNASGVVRVEESVVTLENVNARAADGALRVNGVLDFKDHPNQLDLRVIAKNLKVDQLPSFWWESRTQTGHQVLPHFLLESNLDGHANVKLILEKSGTRYDGTGEAALRLRGFTPEQADPILISLKPHAKGFEFQQKPGKSTSRLDHPRFSIPGSGSDALLALANLFTQPAPPDRQPEKGPKKIEDAKQKREPAKKAPTFLDLNLNLRDVDLADLIKKLEVDLPVKIAGRITVAVKASIPTDAPSELKGYRLKGLVTLPRLTIEDLTLEKVQAKISYADGKLSLDELSAVVPEPGNPQANGSFKGAATVGVVPAGDLHADLSLNRLPVSQVLGLIPELAKGAQGHLSGRFELNAPAKHLRDPKGWTANARLSAEQVKAIGWSIEKVNFDAKIKDGSLLLEKLTGVFEGASLSVTGNLKLLDKYPFKGRIELKKMDLASFNKLAPMLKPPVRLEGQLETTADIDGNLRPFTIHAGGIGSASAIKVEEFPIDKLDFRWNVNNERVQISDIRSQLFGGSISGSANIPLRNEGAGGIDLKLKALDLAELAQKVPAISGVQIEGKAEGTLKASIPAHKPDEARRVTAELEVQASKLKIRMIPAERLRVTAEYQKGVLAYKVAVAALGGTIELKGRYPPAPAAPDSKAPELQSALPGRIQIEGVKLSKLWALVGAGETFNRLAGEIHLNLPFNYDADGRPVGTGTVRIERLSYGEQLIAPRLQSTARLTEGELRFEKIESAFGLGTLRGLVIVDLNSMERSRAIVTLRGVPAKRLLLPWPDIAKRIDASLDVQLKTTLGPEMRGSAVVTTTRGRFYGQRLGALRFPVEWQMVPSQQRGIVTIRDMGADLAQGRLTGHATYEYFGDAGARVEGALHFNNINIPSLIRTETDLDSLGIGHATGDFEFSSQELRTLDDLNGTLKATLGQTDLSQLPVLNEILPFLGPSSRTADRRSELQARLARGVWRVENLVLVGRNLQLFAEGTVRMSGQLNLSVTANTGRLNINPVALRLFGLKLPVMVGPIPVGMVANLTQYLSNQTIHLEVTGTIANPTVRIQPLRTLSEDAIRFFFNQKNIPLP